MSTTELDVLVVLVTHNAADDLEPCVESVRAGCGDCTSEIIVVDSGSTDGTARVAESLGVRTLQLPNVGYGAGNNEGVRSGPAARYVFFVNPDARIRQGSISDLVRYADERPHVGVLAPRLVAPDGVAVPSLAPFESSWQRLRHQVTGHELGEGNRSVDDFASFGCATGCALVVRSECFASVGGFDERFFLYAEERDLQRATSERWEHSTFPPLVVEHDTAGRLPETRLFSQVFRADLYYARKWDGRLGEIATRAALAFELLRRLTARDDWFSSYVAALRVVLTERVLRDADEGRARQIHRTLGTGERMLSNRGRPTA